MTMGAIGLAPRIPAAQRLDDSIFFTTHKDRQLRIRAPCEDVYTKEFRGFGPHLKHRRRVIVSRISMRMKARHNVDFMRIPFLLFADETVEDTDETLRPILHKIMLDAR